MRIQNAKSNNRVFYLLIVLMHLLLVAATPATIHATSIAVENDFAVVPSQGEGPIDPVELETFLDSYFGRIMEEEHIAGAAISVVKDGRIFFAKGYGHADVEKGIPVDPEQTIFHIGSVGKLFTWTAVMQLVEQGKLDLDTDINTYLDFQIPNTFSEPITLKNLMTHTSGFEDMLLESIVSDANDLEPAREWLVSHMAVRVSPPGDRAGYSNYNAMLAGYIVSRVSGQSYDEYIKQHIFSPLGMLHSSAQSLLLPDLSSFESKGYTFNEGVLHTHPEYIAQPALLPSGGHRASVTDMARFMIAHLQGGVYRDMNITEARILDESTANQMLGTLYTPDPRLLGTAYGFFDLSDNGQRTLGSEGYFPPTHSQLLLLPDQNLGVFVTFNSSGAGLLTIQHLGFQRAFFDHYYPPKLVFSSDYPTDFLDRAKQFVGVYRNSSSPQSTVIKVIELFGGYTLEISDPGDGTLVLNISGLKWKFVEVEPLFFQQVDGPFHILFFENDRGKITHMYSDIMPQYTNVKLDWYEKPGFSMALLLVCLLVFLSLVPIELVRKIRRRRREGDSQPAQRGVRVARGVIIGVSILNLLFMVGTVLWMFNLPTELGSIPLLGKITLGLGVVSAMLTITALVSMVLAWKYRYWDLIYRTYYSLVTAAAVAFVWFLNFWNLLGWRF